MPAKRRLALLLSIPILLVVGVTAAWAIDTAGDDATVARNVTAGGFDLDGMERAEVEAVATQLTSRVDDTEVVLSTGDDLLETTAGELGAEVDGAELADRALEARRGGVVLLRPFRWLAGIFTTTDLDLPYRVDEGTATAEVERLAEDLPAPTEPSLEVRNGRIRAVPGADGQTLDPTQVVAALPDAFDGSAPHVVDVEPIPRPPVTELATMEAAASEANAALDRSITVRVEDQETGLTPEELRDWAAIDQEATPATWTLDSAAVNAALRPRFSDLGPPDDQPRFDVVDGTPVVVPGSGLHVCCAADSGARIAEALKAGAEEVTLDTAVEPSDAGVAELQALGIVEEVSTFTTNHACCENRVRNIQRFADLVRGSIIRPGERFSLNEAVGRRTAANGFLPAGAIIDGVLEPQVGGGVSQFATTFFNAAFFGGLDFVEYQAHSIYFSRYPRGREATISWPKPDLVVENTTPYGILVWPTYTSTSITVTFYSTRNVDVQDLGRSESKRDQCTRVTTTRQRTWADGRTETDTVFATYRPAEGLNCSGQPTNRAQEDAD